MKLPFQGYPVMWIVNTLDELRKRGYELKTDSFHCNFSHQPINLKTHQHINNTLNPYHSG
jgi:hypothetical protein